MNSEKDRQQKQFREFRQTLIGTKVTYKGRVHGIIDVQVVGKRAMTRLTGRTRWVPLDECYEHHDGVRTTRDRTR